VKRIIHIAEWGMDGHGDGTELQPFRTVARAMRHLRSTAKPVPFTILIAPGTYVEEPLHLPRRGKLRGRR